MEDKLEGIDSPNGTNVDLGDLLVVKNPLGTPRLAPIENINCQNGIKFRATAENLCSDVEHYEAIILKKDGTYLIGK